MWPTETGHDTDTILGYDDIIFDYLLVGTRLSCDYSQEQKAWLVDMGSTPHLVTQPLQGKLSDGAIVKPELIKNDIARD